MHIVMIVHSFEAAGVIQREALRRYIFLIGLTFLKRFHKNKLAGCQIQRQRQRIGKVQLKQHLLSCLTWLLLFAGMWNVKGLFLSKTVFNVKGNEFSPRFEGSIFLLVYWAVMTGDTP